MSESHDAKPCPSCGHCPTCGRGAQPIQYFYPWYVPQPWMQPYPWTLTGYNTGGSIGTVGAYTMQNNANAGLSAMNG